MNRTLTIPAKYKSQESVTIRPDKKVRLTVQTPHIEFDGWAYVEEVFEEKVEFSSANIVKFTLPIANCLAFVGSIGTTIYCTIK